MRKSIRFKLLGALVLAVVSVGCMHQRYITTRTWVGDDLFYIAYAESNNPFTARTRVLKCNRRDDNQMSCSTQDELNAALNK